MKKIFIFLLIILILSGCTKEVEVEKTEITFHSLGGTFVEKAYSKAEYEAKIKIIPELTGFNFAGWYMAETNERAPEFLQENINIFTVYAKWVNKKTEVLYQVLHFYENADGTYLPDYPDKRYELVGFTVTAIPNKLSYRPYYTYNKNHPDQIKSGVVLADGSLVLKLYYSLNFYTLVIDESGAKELSDVTTKYGESIEIPTFIHKDGFTFIKWFPNDFNKMPYGGAYIKAVFKKDSHAVICFYTLESDEFFVNYVKIGNKAIKPVEPTRVGYKFVGWYLDDQRKTLYDFDTLIYENITLYAKWVIDE